MSKTVRPARARATVSSAVAVAATVLAAAVPASADRFTPIAGAQNEISFTVTRQAGAQDTELSTVVDCGPLSSHLELAVDPVAGEVIVEHGTLCGTSMTFFPSAGEMRLSLPVVRTGSVAGESEPVVGSLDGGAVTFVLPVLASANVGSFGFETGRRTAADAVELSGRLDVTEDGRYRIADLGGTAEFEFSIQSASYTVAASIALNLEGSQEALDVLFANGFENGDPFAWSSAVGVLR